MRSGEGKAQGQGRGEGRAISALHCEGSRHARRRRSSAGAIEPRSVTGPTAALVKRTLSKA